MSNDAPYHPAASGGFVVAYHVPHNDGVASGILDGPDQDTGLDLVDLYEVDACIATFATREEAEAWLKVAGELGAPGNR